MTGTATTTPRSVTVKTKMNMDIELDIDNMTDDQKLGTGMSIAYGMHAACCEGVSSFWTSLGHCLIGRSNVTGVSFGIDLAVAPELGDHDYACTSPVDCYGTRRLQLLSAEQQRLLAATTLSNEAEFSITSVGESSADTIATASSSLESAQAADKFSPASILKHVEVALSRPKLAAKIGDASIMQAIKSAVGNATITLAALEVTDSASTSAKVTSGAGGGLSFNPLMLLMMATAGFCISLDAFFRAWSFMLA